MEGFKSLWSVFGDEGAAGDAKSGSAAVVVCDYRVDQVFCFGRKSGRKIERKILDLLSS